jgi:hypothetical protein
MQIKSIIVRNRAIEFVRTIPLDVLHEVIIRPYKKDRSLLQNAYYWVILTIIGKFLGYTKKEMHRQYKGQLLVPIMLKYPDDYPDFCEMVSIIQGLRDSDRIEEADKMAVLIIRLVTTTKLKVAHMAEYITDIKNHAASLDIRLPAPEYD